VRARCPSPRAAPPRTALTPILPRFVFVFARAARYHPDLNKDDKAAAAKFHDVQAAYDLLSDDSKRAAYDSYGHAGVEAEEAMGGAGMGRGRGGGAPEGFEQFMGAEELFNRMFSEFSGGGGRGRGGGGGGGGARRGGDVQAVVSVPFMDSVAGCVRSITAPVMAACEGCKGTGSADGKDSVTCPSCKGLGQQVMQSGMMMMSTTCRRCGGEGSIIKNPCRPCSGAGVVRKPKTVTINVPAGVEAGTNLRLSGEGDAGERGAPAGHFYVRVNVEEDPFFKRQGTDVLVELPITFAQAALGATVAVPTVKGEAEVRVPPGTQPGDTTVLRGKGIRRVGGMPSSAGNQVITFKVEVPRVLSEKMRAVLEELVKEEQATGAAAGAAAGGAAAAAGGLGTFSAAWRSLVSNTIDRVKTATGAK
jgi:molecular chaperone DnaJ